MKPTTTETGAAGGNRECSRSRNWSCSAPIGGKSISHSGDYSISSQIGCRRNRTEEAPAGITFSPEVKATEPDLRGIPNRASRSRCLDCPSGKIAGARLCDLADCRHVHYRSPQPHSRQEGKPWKERLESDHGLEVTLRALEVPSRYCTKFNRRPPSRKER